MINNVIDIRCNDLDNIRSTIEKTLSSYIEKFVQDDGNVKYKEVNDKYFFENDSWNVSIVGKIEQFKEEYSKYNQKRQNIVFSLNNKNINLELKYVYYKKLFNEFTIKWREEVNILNNINDIVVKEMNVCNIDSILNGEDLKVSLEGDYKSIDKYKEIFDIKKLNAEFSKQTFKEIMIATQDNNNRIKNIDKEQ